MARVVAPVFGAVLCAVGIAACELPSAREVFGRTEEGNFVGGVVAEEPRAVLIGRDILTRGGSVADAAVATYFAMAVTWPGTAGLGGGGSCLIHDPEEKRQEALVFVPLNYIEKMRTRGVAQARDLAMVPGNPRGMFALHARYGRVRWEQLLKPAVELARNGHPVSRALARQLEAAPARALADPNFMRIFAPRGAVLREGDPLVQVELATILSLISGQDAGILYNGDLAGRFANGAAGIGVDIDRADLAAFVPEYLPTIKIEFGSHDLHFAPPPSDGSVLAAQQFAFLSDGGRYRRAQLNTRQHLFAEAQLIAMAGLQDWVRNLTERTRADDLVSAAALGAMQARYDENRHRAPEANLTRRSLDVDHGSVGLVVTDAAGASVACSFSMNAPFGTGKMVPGTGILLGAPVGDPGALTTPSGVVMLTNSVNNIFFYAAASGGGIGGSGALAQVSTYVLEDELSLEDAIELPRLYAAYGRDDVLLYESWMDSGVVTGLGARGHRTIEANAIGIVSAIHCPGGLPRDRVCSVVSDPRGAGLAMVRQSR
ncbi:MAG: gamma-glutamyltransferase [Alphaproteobacteria bacterium]|nr:gamma-glutamyltransferase [Alphaproteobacteria bacterium]